MPVNKTLVLETFDELKAEHFLDRRELGVINVGGDGIVTVNGKSAYVTGIAPKGYTTVASFKAENGITINGDTVDTPHFTVKFDEAYQIVSLYDKANDREVIKAGGCGI